ncbi:MAG: hypothetical protein K0V04_13535 [Deltaproteobacteria bacterium]|nr:hypothetical protein [Deltaproteobacteria bacterium]
MVYDDDKSLINVFFADEYGLGGLKSDLDPVGVPDVNEPSDAKDHMMYHGQLADALEAATAPEELVNMVRNADEKHGHMKLPMGTTARENAGGALFSKKWIDKNTARSLLPLL